MCKRLSLFIGVVLFFSSCTRLLINQHVKTYNKKNGLPLPELLLEDISGKMINTADFKGKVILLNTWGTWCHACINDMPGLNYINEKLSDQPDFLLLNICAQSNKEQWQKVIIEQKLSGINLYLPDSLFQKYNALGIKEEGWPYNMIVGKEGKVLGSGIDVEAKGENLLAIYSLLKAMDNIDARASTKELITLSRKMKKIDDPEMKAFKEFFGKYVDTTSVQLTGKFLQ